MDEPFPRPNPKLPGNFQPTEPEQRAPLPGSTSSANLPLVGRRADHLDSQLVTERSRIGQERLAPGEGDPVHADKGLALARHWRSGEGFPELSRLFERDLAHEFRW